jgi:hypothetical protein
MSDLGVIVTGVVVGSASGIGGAILGAWMNGRSQMAAFRLNITAEDKRARNSEKRRIYAACLAAAHQMPTFLQVERILRMSDAIPDKKVQAWLDADKARTLLRNRVAELELIGPPAVAIPAGDVLREALSYTNRTDQGGVDIKDGDLTAFTEVVEAMRRAMLADLGIDSDELVPPAASQ